MILLFNGKRVCGKIVVFAGKAIVAVQTKVYIFIRHRNQVLKRYNILLRPEIEQLLPELAQQNNRESEQLTTFNNTSLSTTSIESALMQVRRFERICQQRQKKPFCYSQYHFDNCKTWA